MRKLKGVIIVIFITIFNISTQAQSLSKMSDIELEAKKQEAIVNENFELAKQIKLEQDARKSINDKLKEKTEELATAIKNEDFAKAETLKKEITQLEEIQAKLKVLEEDKKIAIFKEDYDKVMALDTEINNLKKGTTPTTVESIQNTTPNGTQNTLNPTDALVAVMSNAKQTKAATKKVSLADVEFKDKIISHVGVGFGTADDGFYEEGIFAINYLANRWWVNKYLVGGWNIDLAPSEYGSLAVGGQMAVMGDFDAVVLPYTSLGLGFGMDIWEEEVYFPFVFRVGSYVSFNKTRNFGAFAEFNLYVNNDYMPKIRFGLAWSRVKRRAKR